MLTERAVGSDTVDLDTALVRLCLQDLKERFNTSLSGPLSGPEHQLAMWRLRAGCERAKRKLSQWSQARVEVSGLLDGLDYQVSVSRGHFEDFAQLNIDPLLDPIDWCLEDSGLGRSDVDVVLVGGCARIPRMRRAIREFFYGRPAREVLRPDHAAVLGAAVYAAAMSRGADLGDERSRELGHIRLEQVRPWAEASPDESVSPASEDPDSETGLPIQALVLGGPPPPADDDMPDDLDDSSPRPPSLRDSFPPSPPSSGSGHSSLHVGELSEVPGNESTRQPPLVSPSGARRSATGLRYL